MIQKFIQWVREVLKRMLHVSDVKKVFSTEVAVSRPMQEAIDIWKKMFFDNADWLNDTTKSLGLPAAIASEIARLTTVEMESEITGSQRADFLNEEYEAVLKGLPASVEYAAAGGGVVFKPYVDSGHIAVEAVEAWRFIPTAYNSRKEITGAVFVERVQKGKTYFTRMEHHAMEASGYRITNKAFRSDTEKSLGHECPLGSVEEWAELEPEIILTYTDGTAPEKMMFAYFGMPAANNIDPASPLGVSSYARAVSLIEEADKQYSRILWEYEGSELAVDATYGALKYEDGKLRMPQGKKRLFRELNIDKGDGGDLYQVFSPTIRDASLFNGLDKILKRIEFNCNLAYGTLSDPQNVDKTAEEIKASKQRSYASVCLIQKSLQDALEHLVWIMDYYASLYNLAPSGEYEVGFTWGDSINENTDLEFARRMNMAQSGYLKPEKVIAWYFGVTEEEAAEYMPDAVEPLTL